MSFLTEAEVLDAAVAYFSTAFADPATGKAPAMGPRTFFGQFARALASLIGEVLATAKSIDDDALPYVYTDAAGVTRTRNTSQRLDDWAFIFGLPSDVSGKYGRRGATAARGGGATATGSVGVIVATGALLSDPSTTVSLKLRTGFTMPGSGSQAITIDAVTTGEAGNLPVGTVLRWVSPPPGLASTVTLTTALSGGYSIESDVDLALRIVRRLQNRPRGGSCYDYREWAESAEDGSGGLVGVLRAYIYPGREGAGSVTVVPTLGGSGSARIPSTTQIAQIQAWIDSLKICTDTAFVIKPRVVSGEELTVTATVQPQTAFDWIDTFTVSAVSGTGTTLVVDGLPSTLRDAIDNGNKPRIAITINSYSPIPFVSRVTAHQDGVPMVGQYTLTLETALPTSPAGYRVHPGGSATVPVASAILATIDTLGPSRSSGCADPNDKWEDRVTVAALASSVVRAVDSNGERVVVTSPGVGVGTGITIKIGAAAASGADYTTLDSSHTLGPPIPRCIAVIIRSA